MRIIKYKHIRDITVANALPSEDKGAPIADGRLRPEALCIVHATKHMPERRKDGSVLIHTTSSATDNASPRNTLHVALNHKVAAHFYASWEEAPIAVVAPFTAMCAANGAPATLNTVDTFWTGDLGQRLAVPDATLVLPGETDGVLYKLSQGETRYKTSRFTEEDIAAIRASETYSHYDDQKLKELGVDAAARAAFFAGHVHRMAVNATIRNLGYQVQPGNTWAWSESRDAQGRMIDGWGVTEATSVLADEMGTDVAAHTHTIYQKLELAVEHWNSLTETRNRDGVFLTSENKDVGVSNVLADGLYLPADNRTRRIYKDWVAAQTQTQRRLEGEYHSSLAQDLGMNAAVYKSVIPQALGEMMIQAQRDLKKLNANGLYLISALGRDAEIDMLRPAVDAGKYEELDLYSQVKKQVRQDMAALADSGGPENRAVFDDWRARLFRQQDGLNDRRAHSSDIAGGAPQRPEDRKIRTVSPYRPSSAPQ